MNEHNSIASLVNAINAILYQAGGTGTDAALNWVDKNAFTTAAGNRDHVIDIVIVMTDGKSANAHETAAAAAQLHEMLWNCVRSCKTVDVQYLKMLSRLFVHVVPIVSD
jgi:uncharacterized protein YegL